MSEESEKHVRGMGSLYQRGPIWWIAYCHRGRAYRETSRSTKRSVAERLLKKRIGEVTGGRFVGPQQERVTYDQLERLYLDDYRLRRLRSGATVKARVKHLRHAFGLDRAVDLTPDRLRAYQARRRDEGAEPGTVNRELSALHRMFNLARRQGLLSVVPVFPERLQENEPRQGFFEHDQYQQVRTHLPNVFQDVLDFGYWSGWRRREVTGLMWQEVDLEGGVIRLSPERSKTRRGRVLPLSAPLREVLKRREAARLTERGVTDMVFHQDGQPIGDWRKRWLKACVEAGLYTIVKDENGKETKVPDRLFHDLRRTCVRNLIRAGVPQHTAMAWTGHTTASVFRTYDIISESDLRKAGDRLTAYVVKAAKAGAK